MIISKAILSSGLNVSLSGYRQLPLGAAVWPSMAYQLLPKSGSRVECGASCTSDKARRDKLFRI